MSTPASTAREVPIDKSLLESTRHRRRAAQEHDAVRWRYAPALESVPTVKRDTTQVHATWTAKHSRRELTVRSVPPGIQVRHIWLHSGTVFEQTFIIHSSAEFERWHANAPTKFDHPVAHDEIRRFADGKLVE